MPKDEKKKDWRLIIDSHYLCYRSFYTIAENLQFRKHDTNIIYGFLMQLKKLAEQFDTNQFVFCFDSPKSYRKMLYPQYKTRPLKPDVAARLKVARYQFEELEEEVLPWMGFQNVYSQNGYESDDIIAELCFRCPDDYIIVSGDEDLYQLLDEGPVRETRMYNFTKTMKASDIRMAYGIDPQQWRMVKAIAGCTSDTVEGIEGAGETKAIKYILKSLPDGKIKTRIDEGYDIIQRNLDLVALPLTISIAKPLEVDFPVTDNLYTADFMEVFSEYGFASFLKKESLDEWKKAFGLLSGRKGDKK